MLNQDKNIIITGIPRSGTTLLTAMIDSAPNSVALNEPKWQYKWAAANANTSGPEDFTKWLVGDFVDIRRKIFQQIPIIERRLPDGSAVTNYYRIDTKSKDNKSVFDLIPFTRKMENEEFTLAIKHNGLYLSVLEELANTGFFKIYAIIRNPLGVISSWHHVPIPLGKGYMPGAIMYWKEMRELTGSQTPLLRKQVMMYDLICERLDALRDRIEIILYEDYVETLSHKTDVKERDNRFYGDTNLIQDAIAQHGNSYKKFYPAA